MGSSGWSQKQGGRKSLMDYLKSISIETFLKEQKNLSLKQFSKKIRKLRHKKEDFMLYCEFLKEKGVKLDDLYAFI